MWLLDSDRYKRALMTKEGFSLLHFHCCNYCICCEVKYICSWIHSFQSQPHFRYFLLNISMGLFKILTKQSG